MASTFLNWKPFSAWEPLFFADLHFVVVLNTKKTRKYFSGKHVKLKQTQTYA
jgi:hypothetical protein